MEPRPARPSTPPSSRQRYRAFLAEYRARRLSADGKPPAADGAGKPPRAGRGAALRAYARWLVPFRGAVALFLVLALVAAGLQMVEPLFLRFIVDRVLLVPGLEASERLARLHAAGAAFLAAVVTSNLLNALKDYRLRLLSVRLMLQIRRALFDRLLRLPLPTLWEMKTGGILSRLTGDVDTTTGMLQLAVVSPTLAIVRLAVACSILVALNWRLAVTAFALVPGIVVVSVFFARRVRPIYRSVREDAERVDGRVGETFSGIRVVRAFRQETGERLDFLRGRHTVLRKELFAQRRELVLWTTWGVIVAGVNVVIVWYGGALSVAGRASVGDIMAFQWYTMLLLNPVWSLVNSFSELQRSLAAMERVFDVLAMPPDKPDRPGAVDAPSEIRELAFDGVGFAYPRGDARTHELGPPVLHDVSATIPGGTVVALVGRSGAGKTTFTDLVARFHDPTAGRVRVNGIDLRDLRLASWRGRLALVQQDVFLFDGTVRENVAFGRRGATDAEVEDAARRANAHEFIVRLPDGYETVVGERGVKLSGGQRQRLAIARAVLAAPAVLILDEATSNLDTESEQLIQSALADLLVGRTTFVIAHRLSTVRRADLILVLEDGRVVERGTHDALMAAGGPYAAMVARQSADAQSDLLVDVSGG